MPVTIYQDFLVWVKKTAKKFLAEFGSMENLLANTDQLKGKMKEKVSENAALGLLSKKTSHH